MTSVPDWTELYRDESPTTKHPGVLASNRLEGFLVDWEALSFRGRYTSPVFSQYFIDAGEDPSVLQKLNEHIEIFEQYFLDQSGTRDSDSAWFYEASRHWDEKIVLEDDLPPGVLEYSDEMIEEQRRYADPNYRRDRLTSPFAKLIDRFEKYCWHAFWYEYFSVYQEELAGQTVVRLNTSFGPIDIELNWDRARWTVFHFLALAQYGYYNNTFLTPNCSHTAERDEISVSGTGQVVKGGFWKPCLNKTMAVLDEMLGPLLKDEGAAMYSSRLHQQAEIEPARRGEICWNGFKFDLYGKALTDQDFFILNKDQEEFSDDEKESLAEFGCIPFGKVISGMDVVDAMSRVPSSVINVIGATEVADLTMPGEVPVLLPDETLVLENIECLSGTPLTRRYKVNSLSELKLREIETMWARASKNNGTEIAKTIETIIETSGLSE